MTKQLNVLIVDPDVDARECLRDLLEAEGYAALSAPPGPEALHLVRQADVPCLVLLNSIARPETALQYLAVLEHEQDMLLVALGVLNESGGQSVEATDNDPSAACACLIDYRMVNRRAFQKALNARLRHQHPIRGLVKTSAERVEVRSC
jgi:CheY-like chemotaxis protein